MNKLLKEGQELRRNMMKMIETLQVDFEKYNTIVKFLVENDMVTPKGILYIKSMLKEDK